MTTESEGTIEVVSLTRDGVAVTPFEGPLEYVDGPDFWRPAALRALAPGGEAVIPLTLTRDPKTGEAILMTVDLHPPPPPANPRAVVPEPAADPRAVIVSPDPGGQHPAGEFVNGGRGERGGRSETPPEARSEVAVTRVERRVRLYPLRRPGLYALRIRYRYTGPDGGRGDVLTDAIESNEIVFRLH